MKKIIIENIKTIIYALIIAVLIRSLLLQPFYIPSSSMEPSLLVGDRLFVTKLSYGYSKHSFPFSLGPIKNRILFSEPSRGDVIVFKTPADNRTDLTSYYKKGSYQNSDEFFVPKDHYFFLGDNRDCSKDSRFLTSVGFVHKNNLVGKAQFIFFSTNISEGSFFEIWNWKKILRIERFFKKII